MNLSKLYSDAKKSLNYETAKAAAIGATVSGLSVVLMGGTRPVALTAAGMSIAALVLSIIGNAANHQLNWFEKEVSKPAITAVSLAALRFTLGMFSPTVLATHLLFSMVVSEAIQLHSGDKPGFVFVV